MKKLAAAVAAIAGATAVVAMGAAPAHAEPVPVDPGIGSGIGTGMLYLEVDRVNGPAERAALFCPGGQGHRQGEAACMHLTGAQGAIEEVDPVDGMCTKEYDPVTLTAVGIWEGEFVHYEAVYGNFCEGLHATGGAIFDIAS
jgi:hypothetical protein